MNILIIDFTIGVNSNKYNIFNNFGLRVLNFQLFFKKLNTFLTISKCLP